MEGGVDDHASRPEWLVDDHSSVRSGSQPNRGHRAACVSGYRSRVSFGPHHNRVVEAALNVAAACCCWATLLRLAGWCPTAPRSPIAFRRSSSAHELINVQPSADGAPLITSNTWSCSARTSSHPSFTSSWNWFDIDRAVRSPLYRLDAKGAAVSNAGVRLHPAKSLV